jgi:hypothetical protein
MAGRFSKRPFLKKPAYVRPKMYPAAADISVSSIGGEGIDEAEETILIEQYFEEKRFSTRLLVWINFALLLLLFLLFIVYIFSPSKQLNQEKQEQSLRKETTESQEEPHRISFTLVPANGSDGRWAIVSLKSYGFNPNSIVYLNVCCLQQGDNTFFCNPAWASFKGHDAKIKIARQNMVGSLCQLIWSD